MRMNIKMKYYLFTLLILCSTNVFAQKDTLYYKENWHPTNRHHARYYGFRTRQNDKYIAEDYYLNGQLQMTGTLTSLDTPSLQYRDGYFTHYASNGYVMDEGAYEHGKEIGEWKYYYKKSRSLKSTLLFQKDSPIVYITYYDSLTQKKKSDGQFLNGNRYGIWKYYDSTGKINETQKILGDTENSIALSTLYDSLGRKLEEGNILDRERMGEWKYYDSTGKINGQCNYVKGIKEGDATDYYPSGAVRRREHYSLGKMTQGNCYTEDGKETEYYPKFLPPEPAVNIPQYLARNIRYPTNAINKNIMGRVIVKFLLTEDGSITDVKVVKGIGGGCDEEAIRVVANMPKWKPGKSENNPIRVFFTLPISFKME